MEEMPRLEGGIRTFRGARSAEISEALSQRGPIKKIDGPSSLEIYVFLVTAPTIVLSAKGRFNVAASPCVGSGESAEIKAAEDLESVPCCEPGPD